MKPASSLSSAVLFDHQALRDQFPALKQTIGDHPLCYLDTAATSQKPQAVIDAMTEYYQLNNANVHRAAHQLSARATQQYESVRQQVAEFIHAQRQDEIIFTHGTTESINMVAYGLTSQIKPNDVILIDTAAHHANIVPWQELAKRTGAVIKPIPLTTDAQLDITAFDQLLALKPKVVTLCHVSNALGTLNPVNELVAKAKAVGALTLVDGAQAIAHLPVDVQQIDCDFYVFSGHKMYGPTGVGILYGRYTELDKLTPMLTGGEMIKTVSFEQTEFGALPNRLEAGTPAIAEVIGLGAAIHFLQQLPREQILAHEQQLLRYLQQQLQQLGAIELYGIANDKHSGDKHCADDQHHSIGAVAFNLQGEHHQDVGILLDQQAVAVRCGHHCAMPLMTSLNLGGCCRASIGIYTNKQDVDQFIHALNTVKELLL
ncbi:aminotransferase class V-fold PLP-dependent enzyme [Shewanella frigidimarina]|uniref:aminotransferase class V-fold PLP-dependent enzyme n=1 Tax=Shewanella frigidimarina TaxID=56812 RepID=UPI000F516283|nr:cysteine desulfurase [Shewanella frigidimarina]RPA33660.1 cysteine desulfurase [Shewanella frigidimarina]